MIEIKIPQEQVKLLKKCLTRHIERWKGDIRHIEKILEELEDYHKQGWEVVL